MNDYKHTQIGYSLIISYIFVVLGIGYVNIVTDFAPGANFALIFIFLVIGIFATLTVDVDNRTISIRFGMGFIRKRFQLNEIECYRVVKNPWYYFLGIRYTPRGWLFAVSGSSAVELEMKNGKLFRIGTDEPERLIKALDNVFSGLESTTQDAEEE
jgi:hypothetical protein